MRLRAFFALLILGLATWGFAISDPEFDQYGAGWTIYTSGSGSVNFDGTVAQLTAFLYYDAGLEQVESAFSTSGQEYRLDIQVNNNGNILAGWRNSSDADGPTTMYANGATGARSILCDDPAYNKVFAEKAGSIGGVINIEYMRTTNVTAPPTYITAPGILTATRASATSANLTWNAATDNVTAASGIVYRIYWSTASGTVISSGVKTTFTGATSGTVTGLPSNQQVFFSVRAADRVGNAESNTVQANIAAASGVSDWPLY